MRVIAGSKKGMKLKGPDGIDFRPTADKVKEALFSILVNRVIDARFIDLYAGSGAIGIEALSRGAASCIFVDNKKQSLRLIEENLNKTMFYERTRIINADVKNTLKNMAAENIKADLVYLDPPYNSPDLASAVHSLFELNIVAENGLVIAEHSSKNRDWSNNFNLFKQKKYGTTTLTIIAEE
ncbi:MAG: 16S rRNA (guanine(966)-N(2))-methyltransferase RsmD [Bacillota bacterium]